MRIYFRWHFNSLALSTGLLEAVTKSCASPSFPTKPASIFLCIFFGIRVRGLVDFDEPCTGVIDREFFCPDLARICLEPLARPRGSIRGAQKRPVTPWSSPWGSNNTSQSESTSMRSSTTSASLLVTVTQGLEGKTGFVGEVVAQAVAQSMAPSFLSTESMSPRNGSSSVCSSVKLVSPHNAHSSSPSA